MFWLNGYVTLTFGAATFRRRQLCDLTTFSAVTLQSKAFSIFQWVK